MWVERHSDTVPSSEFVGRVDMVVDMAVMLKMELSSDDTSHHLLHTKFLPQSFRRAKQRGSPPTEATVNERVNLVRLA